MSKTSKQAETDATFDKTGFADRRAKSSNQKPEPVSDKLNLIRAANSSDGDRHHSVDADDYSANATANPERQLGPRTVDGNQAKWAAGYTKVGGKHITADGLVSRRGYRRIIPGITQQEREWLEEHTSKLREIAKRVLHGRNGTIFQKCVINPLLGERKSSVEEMAAQFNIKPKRVYNIIDKCKDKVLREYNQQRRGSPGKENTVVCRICGRPESSKEICPRGHYGACDRRSYGFRWGGYDGFHTDLRPWREDEAMMRLARVQTERWENKYGPKRRTK